MDRKPSKEEIRQAVRSLIDVSGMNRWMAWNIINWRVRAGKPICVSRTVE